MRPGAARELPGGMDFFRHKYIADALAASADGPRAYQQCVGLCRNAAADSCDIWLDS